MNLTGDILHVYQGFGGLGGGQGDQDLETRTGSGKLVLSLMLFGMSGSRKVQTCSWCEIFRHATYWHQCELEFAGIHAEIQVVGTSGLINAGGPF